MIDDLGDCTRCGEHAGHLVEHVCPRARRRVIEQEIKVQEQPAEELEEILASSVPGPSSNGQNARHRTSWTAAELLIEDFPEPSFAVDGLIPEGLAFMCGAPKLGKSWMGLGLAIASASGGRALAAIEVPKGPALYLALEDSPRRLQARLRLLLAGGAAPEGLQVETEWPRLDEGGIARIEGWLDRNPGARLVLIDVWPRIRPRATKRSDYYQVDYEAAAPLQTVAINRGVSIVALYHTRKAEAEDFVETVQGTFGTAAAADTIIVVKRSRGRADAKLHVTGRDVEEQELALRFTPEVGSWALLGDAADYAIGETRAELLAAVRQHGGLTPKAAADITGISHDLARQTMRRMAQDGQLIGDRGTYKPPVTPVTLSPGEETYGGDEGQSDSSDTGSKDLQEDMFEDLDDHFEGPLDG